MEPQAHPQKNSPTTEYAQLNQPTTNYNLASVAITLGFGYHDSYTGNYYGVGSTKVEKLESAIARSERGILVNS